MAYVELPNQYKIHVKELFVNTTLNEVVADLDISKPRAKRLSAIKVLAEIKKWGMPQSVSALTNLVEKEYTDDYELANQATEALNAIKNGATADSLANQFGAGTDFGSLPICSTNSSTSTSAATESARKKKDRVEDVEVLPFGDDLEAGAKVYKRCNFCEKDALVLPRNQMLLERLTKKGRYFCNFCLRNRYYGKDNRDIMIVTFRGIIGFYYYDQFAFPKNPKMTLSEINDYVGLHVAMGMQNPVFNYDPESMCWFIDFRRVGKGHRLIPLGSVYQTIVEILASFNLSANITYIQLSKIYEKYREAIETYFRQRQRPAGQKICAPTLLRCGPSDWVYNGMINNVVGGQRISIADTRNFAASLLDPDNLRKH